MDTKKAKLTQAAYLRMAKMANEGDEGVVYTGKTYLTESQCRDEADKWAKIVEKCERFDREDSAI